MKKFVYSVLPLVLIVFMLLTSFFSKQFIEKNANFNEQNLNSSTSSLSNATKLLSFNITAKEELENGVVYYGTIPYCNSFYKNNNIVFNCQIAHFDNGIIVGIPIIKSGFWKFILLLQYNRFYIDNF